MVQSSVSNNQQISQIEYSNEMEDTNPGGTLSESTLANQFVIKVPFARENESNENEMAN